MGHIQDIELAAIINYVLTNFGNDQILHPDTKFFSPGDIALRRGQPLSPAKVNARRPDLAAMEF
jgi:hypothetical protein